MSPFFDEIVNVVASIVGRPAAGITSATELQSLGADSLTLLELSLALQKEFQVPLDDEDVARAHTVADVVEVVRRAVLPADG